MALFPAKRRALDRAARGRVDERDAGSLVPGSFLFQCWTESECFEMCLVRMSDNRACRS